MNYLIHLSEQSDHQLQQMCQPGDHAHTGEVCPEDFLSALVQEQLDELFVARREQHHQTTRKDKKLHSAVSRAKQRGKAWREAAAATHVALESVRKLVIEATTDTKKGTSR